MKSFEVVGSRAKYFAGASIAMIALAGCKDATSEEIAASLDPIGRVDYEYGGDEVYFDGYWYETGNRCFFDTVYDPITGKSAADFDISTDAENRVLVTLRANGGNGLISLVGFEDPSKPLEPADEESRIKMDALGCFAEEASAKD
jgi:hypothetical protein